MAEHTWRKVLTSIRKEAGEKVWYNITFTDGAKGYKLNNLEPGQEYPVKLVEKKAKAKDGSEVINHEIVVVAINDNVMADAPDSVKKAPGTTPAPAPPAVTKPAATTKPAPTAKPAATAAPAADKTVAPSLRDPVRTFEEAAKDGAQAEKGLEPAAVRNKAITAPIGMIPDRDIMIARQVAIKAAVELYAQRTPENRGTQEGDATTVVMIARVFEKFLIRSTDQ